MFVRPDGVRVPGRIVVGEPEAVSETEARCPVALEGIGERVWWIHGASTLQALALGVRFLHALLRAEREHGLRVCFEERGGRLVDVEIAATFGEAMGHGGRGMEPDRGAARAEGRKRRTGRSGQKGQKGQRGQKKQEGQRRRTRASAAGTRAGAVGKSGQAR